MRHYWESTVKPACVRRTNTLTELLAPRFGETIEIGNDFSDIKPLQEDEQRRAQIDQILLSTGQRVINELRTRDNLDAVPWGNVPLVSFGLAPLGSSGGLGGGEALLGLSAPRKVWALPLALPPTSRAAAPEDEATRAALWEGLIARSVPYEHSLELQIRRVFAVTADALAGALRTLGSPAAAVTDALEKLRRWREQGQSRAGEQQ